MKPETQNLPPAASQYIQDQFREDFLFEVMEVRKINGEPHYFVEVAKDGMVHLLHFNEQGKLVIDKLENPFRPDILEEPPFDEIPE